ncbi:RNA polymerase sigma factor SigJ [Seohaeicola saemankumensis]|nr:RNA polymerase sigma factor SigJ [Seohaeicola saemankumensis]MCA0870070.1 RNA polymerase sigma factor SigJ [Seohaeicola saemankumensis]
MTHKTTLFEAERPRLIALCYRMLGEVAAAEDVVQDTWLRWSGVDPATLDNPGAWLRRVAANLAIDALRKARTRRETYVGPWLPEPLITTARDPAADSFALAQECELALLWAMERLNEVERAAFILREAFDAGYDEIARTLGRSEPACRQMVSRAHKRLQQAGPRFDAPPDQVADLIARFSAAITAGDFRETLSLMAPDAVAITDGGARARAARRPLVGPAEILQVYAAALRKTRAEHAEATVLTVNRQPALALHENGILRSLLTLTPDANGLIRWIYTMRNPDKLLPALRL